MVKVQFELDEKARKKMEKFMFYNGISSKEEAINKVFTDLDLRADFKDWLKENKEDKNE